MILFVIANTINIAADLAAMGEALRLAVGGSALLYALLFGVTCLVAEVVVRYQRYAGYLKLLTSVLLVYVAAAFSLHIPWGSVLGALLMPTVSLDHQQLLVIVAIFGTTISPYLFFWQASQEVEDMRGNLSVGELDGLAMPAIIYLAIAGSGRVRCRVRSMPT